MDDNANIRLEFDPQPLALAKWLLAALGGALLIFPFAWVLAAVTRWACSQIRFSDGTTAEFRGDGAEIAVWTVLGLGIPVAWFVALGPGGVLFVATLILWLGVWFMAVKWLVYNTHLNTGPQLTFVGGFAAVAAYTVLAKLGIVAAHRWFWDQVKGEAVAFGFDAPAGELFWRTWVMAIVSATIVGAPWALVWYGRWWFAHVGFARGVDTSTWQLRDESPRRLSFPGGGGGL